MELTHHATVEAFLRRAPLLHVYELGDLDDAFRPRTRWFGRLEAGELAAVALLYAAPTTHALLAFRSTTDPEGALPALLAELAPTLPPRLYAHLGIGLVRALDDTFASESHGVHHKMGLGDQDALRRAAQAGDGVEPLGAGDVAELLALYEQAYPDNWFDPHMLDVAPYFGVRERGRLVTVAGFHVVSRTLRVAALGNIATHPAARGRGLARCAIARLCTHLIDETGVVTIGLNVKQGNAPAIACYESLGFTTIADYEELALARR